MTTRPWSRYADPDLYLPTPQILREWSIVNRDMDLAGAARLMRYRTDNHLHPDDILLHSGSRPILDLLARPCRVMDTDTRRGFVAMLMNEGADLTKVAPPGYRVADIALTCRDPVVASMVVSETLIQALKSPGRKPYADPLNRIFSALGSTSAREEVFETFLHVHAYTSGTLAREIQQDESVTPERKDAFFRDHAFWFQPLLPGLSVEDMPAPTSETLTMAEEFNLACVVNRGMIPDLDRYISWQQKHQARLMQRFEQEMQRAGQPPLRNQI